jgi:hypothetical protein
MDLPNEAGIQAPAVPSHQQHQADTRRGPHKQLRREIVIHPIFPGIQQCTGRTAFIHLITLEFSAPI